MSTLPELVITGSTGEVGGRVAARLAARGVEQRLVVRDVSRAPSLPGAEPVTVISYGDTAGMRAALRGANTLFLVSGSESQDRSQQHFAAVDAALDSGIERVVYLSFMAAAADATFTFARDHFATEEHLRASGMRFTSLRASLYADFVPYFTSAEGVIRGPAGDGRVAWVSRDDIADVVVGTLLGDADDGAVYDMTGPVAITMAETASILSGVIDRPVSYRRETLEEARASRTPSGAPAWEIEGWVTSYAAIATGEMDIVSDTVARIAGHPPAALDPFLRANPGLWSHLV